MRNRTKTLDLRPTEWPVTDQERELHCVRHITDPVKHRRFDGEVFEHELEINNEAVTVFVPAPVAHWASIAALRSAGMAILMDDGNKIMYVG